MTTLDLPAFMWRARAPRSALFLFPVLVTIAVMIFVVAIFAGCEGCGGAVPVPTTPREQARATTLVLADGVVLARKQCAQLADDRKDLPLAERCLAAYETAYAALMAAGSTVDAWDDGRRGEVACATSRGAGAARALGEAVASAGGRVPPTLEDGLRLFDQLMAGLCDVDGGAS
jgi:hypothetical protein